MLNSSTYEYGYPPHCEDCGHSESWHTAYAKHEGKELTCYGIACKCTKRFNDMIVQESGKE